jgi:hypothetical protein
MDATPTASSSSLPRRLVSRSSRHLSRQAAKLSVIGPETPKDPQSRCPYVTVMYRW